MDLVSARQFTPTLKHFILPISSSLEPRGHHDFTHDISAHELVNRVPLEIAWLTCRNRVADLPKQVYLETHLCLGCKRFMMAIMAEKITQFGFRLPILDYVKGVSRNSPLGQDHGSLLVKLTMSDVKKRSGVARFVTIIIIAIVKPASLRLIQPPSNRGRVLTSVRCGVLCCSRHVVL